MANTVSDVLTYADDLPVALRYTRLARGMSVRDVGEATGIPFQTVARVESRGSKNIDTIRTLTRWIAGDVGMRRVQ